jgi:predicted ATPase
MHTLLNRFFELALDAVHQYEGTVNQFLGDGFMSLFGAPISHEDHARRGVLAALALQRTLKEADFGKSYGVECTFRMGLNSGLVVVGSIGDNLRMDYSAVGDTTNLAARLQDHATPGDIVISESTSRLVQGAVRLEALPPVQVKGKTEAVPIYKVIGALPRHSPIASRGERTLSAFVGRARELATLEEIFAQVERGHGQVVGIVAEAGGGKSRLLYEFQQRLHDKRVTYLEGRCLSYGSTIPYHPIVDLLRNHCDIRETDGPESIAEKVRFALQEVGMDPEASAPYLLQLLGVKEGTEPLAVFTPEAIRTRTFDMLKQMSLKGSQQRLLIFEIEDLHWIDHTSQEYLVSLVESLVGASMLLLTTYRPGYRPPWLEKSYATQLSLRSLASHDAVTVVHSTRQQQALPVYLEQVILEKAQGNPFFLEELTRAVIEHGDLQKAVVVPDTIQGVLSARLDRLPEAHKRLLQTASVLGREFAPQLLQALWEESTPLEPLLLDLKRLEFLYERARGEESVYVFKHALTQEVTYDSLLTTRRQVLHAAAGHAMERLYPDWLVERSEQLAHHYTEAGLHAQAIGYWQQAGERAIQRSAHVEALHHLTKGLEQCQLLPDLPEHIPQELALQTMLGSVLQATKGYTAPEVRHAYNRARELCPQVEDSPQLFPVLIGLRRFYAVRRELQTARELAEHLLDRAQRQHDPTVLVGAHRELGHTLFCLGEFPLVQAHLEQGIVLYAAQQHRIQSALQDPGISCLCYTAWLRWLLGYPEQALGRIHQGLHLAQELSHPYSLTYALCYAAVLHQCRREEQAAQERAETTVALSAEQGFTYWSASGTILRGWALAMQGRVEEGITQIRQGMETRQITEAALGRSWFAALLAEAYGKSGQPAEGLRTLTEELALVDTNGERFYEAELHSLKGALLLQQSVENQVEAEACFHQAISIAQRQHAKSWELRAATRLARLWQQQGKRQEAHDLLAPVYNWFTEGFDTADLKDAKALLEELSESW